MTARQYGLTQAEADALVMEIKNAVDDRVTLPSGGQQRTRFTVQAEDGEGFSIALYRGARNPAKQHVAAIAVDRGGIPLLRLCVNGTPHTNPDGTVIPGTHWHIYTEGYGDSYATPADDITSPSFAENTIRLLDRFHVIKKPDMQESLL